MTSDFVSETAENYVVAVVRADRNIDQLSHLRGKKACFGPVGDPLTWDLVVSTLRVQGSLSLPRCDQNYMDSVMGYFSEVCAPYDPRNYTQLESESATIFPRLMEYTRTLTGGIVCFLCR